MTNSGLFWIWSAILLVAVLVALIVPFLRRPRKALARAEYDLAIYKDQLRELEEDEASGLITGAEAEAARNEIARRILAADAAREKAERELQAREGGKEKAVALAAALILVPALAFGLYLEKGRPGMPDMPIAERMRLAAEHNDINALVKRVEDRLAKKPDDIQGWLVLAPVYARMGQHDKAVNAWKNAIRLSEKPDPDLYNSLGEALVYANRGRVVPEARQAFEKALKLAPGNPMSRYFLAQAKLQDGNKDEALAELKGLLKDLPDNFAGRPLIERQIAQLEGRSQPPAAMTQGGGEGAAPAAGGPSAKQVRERMRRMANMSPEERQQMIRNMVEGLEQKLQDNPDNLDGWLRLIRARGVLGEKDRAQQAYEKARKVFSGRANAISTLDDAARRQGLKVLAASAPTEPSAKAGGSATDGGPSAEQVRERMRRMANMSPEERQQMIRNMVEGLEQKLQDNPDDPGGWLRLIRAWAVLGEKDKAKAALERARKAMAGNGQALEAIDQLAKKLSL